MVTKGEPQAAGLGTRHAWGSRQARFKPPACFFVSNDRLKFKRRLDLKASHRS